MVFLDNFKDKCKKSGIKVYEGFVDDGTVDAILDGGERTVIDYCICNGIKSIILSSESDEPSEINAEIIRSYINKQFERLTNQYPYNGMIEKAGIGSFKEILNETIERFNLEFNSVFTSQIENSDEKSEDITTIDAWIFHDGCKICVNIFDPFDSSEEITEDVELASLPSEQQLIDKYIKILEEGFKAHQIELVAEYNQKYKEEMNGVLSKIRDFAKNYEKLADMKTQKSRNDLAERLYAKCTMDNQCRWLTKKEVCEIVNEEYMRKIGMEDIEFF